MPINERYFRYLEHFGETVPVRELAASDQPDGVALRHDVDHDVDLALEMAYWEHDRGTRSTYFVLPTAAYWNDERLVDKLLQIQDFGHELGLHLNIVAQWMRGEIDDIAAELVSVISTLRSAGLDVRGVSAHGDPDCYRLDFTNYWSFAELRPREPMSAESGMSAEGVPDPTGAFSIEYPSDHRLRRDDGAEFSLWSVSLEQMGLDYEAVHTSYDRYFTDSGGSWQRSPDPLAHDLRKGRHQVLIHPEYWRGPRQIYFFLSTARSGSKWLTRVLDEATPLEAHHELTLNHRYEAGSLIPDHHTGRGFPALADDSVEVKRLLAEIRSWIESRDTDFADVNVYLPHVLRELEQVFPEATTVMLHRDPRKVVRSIVDRDWYDTPADDRHPSFDIPGGWEAASQFQRACWYVRRTNDVMLDHCSQRVSFEEISADMDRLARSLRSVGLPFYPRLAQSFGTVVDPTPSPLPDYESWRSEQQEIFDAICAPVRHELGYEEADGISVSGLRKLAIRMRRRMRQRVRQWRSNPGGAAESLVDLRFSEVKELSLSHVACDLERGPAGLVAIPHGGRHAHVVLGGATWNATVADGGWPADPDVYIDGTLTLHVSDGQTHLHALMYDEHGSQLDRRAIGPMVSGTNRFAFRASPQARRFDLALYMSVGNLPPRATIERLVIRAVPLAHPSARELLTARTPVPTSRSSRRSSDR